MGRVAVVGASGLVGRHLVATLQGLGHRVVAVGRGGGAVAGAPGRAWDATTPFPPDLREGLDAIVNLAGAPIGPGRWTTARRREILESRVTTTARYAEALGPGGPGALLNASAVGFYGPTGDALVDEASPRGEDFLASVCTRWEGAASDANGRVVLLRSGLVLARDGGVLPPLRRAAGLGLLGRVGTGRQWVPFIHLDDEVRAIVHCLDHEAIAGPVNLVAPAPVRQRVLARAIARALRRPSVVPLPAAAVRLALGEASTLVLDGQRAVPGVLQATGYAFAMPRLEPAIADLLGISAGDQRRAPSDSNESDGSVADGP